MVSTPDHQKRGVISSLLFPDVAVLDAELTLAGGVLYLADEFPEISGQLSQMFGVRSIPFCVLFKDGQPVDGFVGAQPEAKIKELLARHGVKAQPAVDPLADAFALEKSGDLEGAVRLVRNHVVMGGGDAMAYFTIVTDVPMSFVPHRVERVGAGVFKLTMDASLARALRVRGVNGGRLRLKFIGTRAPSVTVFSTALPSCTCST